MREIKFRAWNVWKKKIDNWQEMLKMDLNNVFTGLVYEREHIMQYTGLKDKNGVEIYEGDIVKYDNDKLRFVKWNKHRFEYAWHLIGYGKPSYMCGLGDDRNSEKLEVLGNIYENKELLE